MSKVVHCECGADVRGESEDELVRNVENHVDAHHPELKGRLGREQILAMAHDQ